jgi:hypothetical protein
LATGSTAGTSSQHLFFHDSDPVNKCKWEYYANWRPGLRLK